MALVVGGFVAGGLVGCGVVGGAVTITVVTAAILDGGVTGAFVVGAGVFGAEVAVTVVTGRVVTGRVVTGRVVGGAVGGVDTVVIGVAFVVGAALVVGLGAGAAIPPEPLLLVVIGAVAPDDGGGDRVVAADAAPDPMAEGVVGFGVVTVVLSAERLVVGATPGAPERVLGMPDGRTMVVALGAETEALGTVAAERGNVVGALKLVWGKVRTTDVAVPISILPVSPLVGTATDEPTPPSIAGIPEVPAGSEASTTNPASSASAVLGGETDTAAASPGFASATTTCGLATNRWATSETDAQPREEAAAVPTNQVEIRKKNLLIRTG